MCDDGNNTDGDGCSSDCKKEEPKPNDPVCGNGQLEEGEACDDSNNIDGDGCSSVCTIEEEPQPEAICGNGELEEGEYCDDGNTDDGDGCAADCKSVEEGWNCDDSGCSTECGDGFVAGEEACDDGDTFDGNGCSSSCTVEEGWRCDNSAGFSYCAQEACGDGVVQTNKGEVCDDGFESISDARASYGWDTENQMPYCKMCKYTGYCGDGIVQPGEQCDNGVVVDGKPQLWNGNIPSGGNGEYGGCNADCTLAPACGDGVYDKEYGEACDDGNTVGNDGCEANCKSVTLGWVCPTKVKCRELECGNGKIAAGEACDDGNFDAGDGCFNCMVEAGYKCIGYDRPCTECQKNNVKCMKVSYGDKKLDVDGYEQCDDGNTKDGDGCSSTGQIEPGWLCPVLGEKCVAKACGDGVVAFGEQCDDGNTKDGDGCSARCKLETGWRCPTAGAPCKNGSCGDGYVDQGEECDSGAKNGKGGCSTSCKLDPGYACLTLGANSDPSKAACIQVTCGDGSIAVASGYTSYEQCDDNNKNNGDGCSSTCRIESGYHCSDDGKTCAKGVCGDGHVDVGEECDDHNLTGGDGCTPACKIESVFEQTADGKYKPICGDGITVWDAGEECDDGNLISGDGCSAQCKKEVGFKCTDYSKNYPPSITLQAVHRDFRGWDSSVCSKAGDTSDINKHTDGCITTAIKNKYGLTDSWFEVGKGHPDFNHINTNEKEIVGKKLGADGLPVYTKANPNTSTQIHEQSFRIWYRDYPGINRTIKKPLKLTLQNANTGTYSYSSSAFFPIAGEGYGNEYSSYPDKNFGFTTHIQTYFKYRGNNEQLDFSGDDDVWVFVNGTRSIDLGGCHSETPASFNLSGVDQTKTVDGKTYKYKYNATYDLYEGGIYPISFFQAERMTSGSNFKLTLAGFLDMGTTICESICGDGIVAGAEECDLGSASADEWYINGCDKTKCVKVATCGNGKIEAGEACDKGDLCAQSKYSSFSACKGVTPKTDAACISCDYASCGDGTKQSYEECDPNDSSRAGLKAGERCLSTCKVSRCGDGFVDKDAGEECDDSNTEDNDMCTSKCKIPVCGDGIVTEYIGEICDDGKNDGSYGSCGQDCSYRAPYCGDGKVTDGEVCDDGKNDGSYGGCKPGCKERGPHCGDGKLDEEYEACDGGNDCNDKCQTVIL